MTFSGGPRRGRGLNLNAFRRRLANRVPGGLSLFVDQRGELIRAVESQREVEIYARVSYRAVVEINGRKIDGSDVTITQETMPTIRVKMQDAYTHNGEVNRAYVLATIMDYFDGIRDRAIALVESQLDDEDLKASLQDPSGGEIVLGGLMVESYNVGG